MENQYKNYILNELRKDLGKSFHIIYDNHIERLKSIQSDIDDSTNKDILETVCLLFCHMIKQDVYGKMEIFPDHLKIQISNSKFNNEYEVYMYVLNQLELNTTEKCKNEINQLKNELKNLYTKNKSCYVATMVYKDIDHPKVELLRRYRDNKLSKHILGMKIIKFYYAYSPKWVVFLKDKEILNRIIKKCLDFMILIIKK